MYLFILPLSRMVVECVIRHVPVVPMLQPYIYYLRLINRKYPL